MPSVEGVKLRVLLTALQRSLEKHSMPMGVKLRALHALSVLAGYIESDLADEPDAHAQVAMLLELSDDVPSVRVLLAHYPTLR
ncbi:hypothetical protein [Pseudorhodoferax soli]|uniref:HEAT repeat protein n=1 Tax=Pseudorhodoferax soli TaxID=545864 RepID=A0A368XTY3_9BURK|nr:hypothetical protein [Pseudorhodoferax soli]RCW69484.1 hypothetical protein DES41_106358 [Pseudorhodoferax soli]